MQTFVDTTTGEPLPPGQRGAFVADNKTAPDATPASPRTRPASGV
jgi:hypothetical protein